MKFYYSPGTCSQSVHIALIEAGVDHEAISVDLASKAASAGGNFTTINNLGYVPALELDDGEVLLEAPAILQYIADQNPAAKLAPANGTMDRIRLQAKLNFVASELHKSFGPFFAPVKPEGALLDQAVTKLRKRLDQVDTELADGRPFIMGNDFTLADTYLFVVTSWTPHVGLKMEDWPNIAAYSERLAARPSIAAARRKEGLV